MAYKKKEKRYGYYKITCAYQMIHNDYGIKIQYFYDLENVVTQEIFTHVNNGFRKLNKKKTHYGYVHESGIWLRFTPAKESKTNEDIK